MLNGLAIHRAAQLPAPPYARLFGMSFTCSIEAKEKRARHCECQHPDYHNHERDPPAGALPGVVLVLHGFHHCGVPADQNSSRKRRRKNGMRRRTRFEKKEGKPHRECDGRGGEEMGEERREDRMMGSAVCKNGEQGIVGRNRGN